MAEFQNITHEDGGIAAAASDLLEALIGLVDEIEPGAGVQMRDAATSNRRRRLRRNQATGLFAGRRGEFFGRVDDLRSQPLQRVIVGAHPGTRFCARHYAAAVERIVTGQRRAAALLARWDAGEPLLSVRVSMPGMADVYEATIQVLGFEFLRALSLFPAEVLATGKGWRVARAYTRDALWPAVVAPMDPSYNQWDGGFWLASCLLSFGSDELVAQAKKTDRLIVIERRDGHDAVAYQDGRSAP